MGTKKNLQLNKPQSAKQRSITPNTQYSAMKHGGPSTRSRKQMLRTEGMRGSSALYKKKGKKGGSPESNSKTRSQTNFTQSKSSATIQSKFSKINSRKRLSTVKKTTTTNSRGQNRHDVSNTIEYTGRDGNSQIILVGGPHQSLSTKH